MIREATHTDVSRLVEMGRDFVEGGEYWGKRKRFSVPVFAAHLARMIDLPQAGFFVSETQRGKINGAFVALIADDIFSGGQVALKLHWLVEPDGRGCGLRLLRHVQRWARDRGATQISVSAINDNSARILARLGFAECERVFHKAL